MIRRIKSYTLHRFFPAILDEMEGLRRKVDHLEGAGVGERDKIRELLKEKDSLAGWKLEMEGWTPEALNMVHQLLDSTVERLRKTEKVRENYSRLLQDTQNISDVIAQMRDSIHSAAAQAGEVAELAKKSADKCQQGRQTLEKSSDVMDSLKTHVGEIGKTMERIEKISENTNLLALNAVIEATNAGVAGKGFTVVAHEVKSLARETAGRAEEIKSKTDALRSASEKLFAVIKGGGLGQNNGDGSVMSLFQELTSTAFCASDSGQAIARDVQRQLGESNRIVDYTRRLKETAEMIRAAGEENVREAVFLAAQARNILAMFDKIDKRQRSAREMVNAAVSGHRSWMVLIRGWIQDPRTVYDLDKIAGPDKCAVARLKAHSVMERVDFSAVDGPGGPHRKLHENVAQIARILTPLKNGQAVGADADRRKAEAEALYWQVWELSDAVVAFLRKL